MKRVFFIFLMVTLLAIWFVPQTALAGAAYYVCDVEKVGAKYITNSRGDVSVRYYIYVTDTRGRFANKYYRLPCKEMLAAVGIAAKSNNLKVMICVDPAIV